MVHWTQTAANYLDAGLFVIAKKRRGCTSVPLYYLIRFPLAKGVNLHLRVHADCWCVQKVWWFYLLALVELYSPRFSRHCIVLLCCIPSFSAPVSSSHLSYAMQVLPLGVQLSLSMIFLYATESKPVDTTIFSILVSPNKPFLSWPLQMLF